LDALRTGRVLVSPAVVSELLRALDALRAELASAVATEETGVSMQVGAPSHGTTLRIDAAKLDRMLSLSGELSIARGRLRTHLVAGGPAALNDALESHLEADRLYRELQDEIMRARLVPLGPIFRQYQ